MSLATISGGSTGQLAATIDNCLQVRLMSEFEQAVRNGLAFSWSNLTYDPAAIDTILAVENNSATYDLCIEKIILSSDTSSQMVVHAASGVALSGTAIVGTNLNRNSANTAPATAVANEVSNTASTAYTYRLLTVTVLALQSVVIEVGGAIVLPNDHMIGADLTTAATAANCTFIGYFRPHR